MNESTTSKMKIYPCDENLKKWKTKKNENEKIK
jgi:hypothetical protein